MAREPQRIAKLLARAGIASRREVERMIAEGRVAVAGTVVDTPATLLETLHQVTVDGNPVREAAPARLFRFNKPAGFLTAERDPEGRPTIYDRLPPGLPRLVPVGRLDMNTEGLLLLTTDGGLKRQLELPSTGVERSYRARAFGDISQQQLEELIHGIEIEGMRYGQIDANLERRTGRNQWIEMRLTEGKNREVRRVLEHLGLQVSRLIRTAYGPFHLEGLAPGDVDEVRQHDLIAFRRMLDGKPPLPTTDGGAASDRPRRAAPAPTSGGERRPARPQSQDRSEARRAGSRPPPHGRGASDRASERPGDRTARGPRPAMRERGSQEDGAGRNASAFDRRGNGRGRTDRDSGRPEWTPRGAVSADRASRPDRTRTGERDDPRPGSRAPRASASPDRARRPDRVRTGERNDARPDSRPRGAASPDRAKRPDRSRTGERDDARGGRPSRGSGSFHGSRSETGGAKPREAGAHSDRPRRGPADERGPRAGTLGSRPASSASPRPKREGAGPDRGRSAPSSRDRRDGPPRGRGPGGPGRPTGRR